MHASGSFANRLTQDGPINVRPQLFAAHKAAGRALNRRTPFCRHLPGHPVTHVLGLYPKTDGKFAHATHSVDGSLNGSHALITHYVEHVCQRPVLCQPPASVYAGGVNETPIELVLRLAQQKKWNQAQLAEHLGVTDQSITNWKKRGLPMDKLPLIAEKLGCSTDYLLGRGPEPSDDTTGLSLVAQLAILDAYTVPPTKTMEDVVAKRDLGKEFSMQLPDDALAPDRPKGLNIIWSRERKPNPGSPVLVLDAHQRLHARLYSQGRRPDHWLATPTNRGYLELDSDADQLELVATGLYRAET